MDGERTELKDDRPLIYIVEDDAAMRDALADLFASIDLDAADYRSAEDWFNAELPDRPGCLVVDIELPGKSGLELQSRLIEEGSGIPIIFITGQGDVRTCANAMKKGAVEFFTKPFDSTMFIDAALGAVEADRRR